MRSREDIRRFGFRLKYPENTRFSAQNTVELADGRKVVADENYIRESTLQPQAKIVKGYQPIMPSFQGQLTEEQISDIIEFIKTLK